MNNRLYIILIIIYLLFGCNSQPSIENHDKISLGHSYKFEEGTREERKEKNFKRLLELADEKDLRKDSTGIETFRLWWHRGFGSGILTLARVELGDSKLIINEISLGSDGTGKLFIDSTHQKNTIIFNKEDSIRLKKLIRESHFLSLKERDIYEDEYIDGEFWRMEARGNWGPYPEFNNYEYLCVERNRVHGKLKELFEFVIDKTERE